PRAALPRERAGGQRARRAERDCSSRVGAMKDVRVAAVQMESAAGDRERDFGVLERLAEHAAQSGARIVAFPECCLTGYWFLRRLGVPELAALAEPLPDGPAARRLRAL